MALSDNVHKALAAATGAAVGSVMAAALDTEFATATGWLAGVAIGGFASGFLKSIIETSWRPILDAARLAVTVVAGILGALVFGLVFVTVGAAFTVIERGWVLIVIGGLGLGYLEWGQDDRADASPSVIAPEGQPSLFRDQRDAARFCLALGRCRESYPWRGGLALQPPTQGWPPVSGVGHGARTGLVFSVADPGAVPHDRVGRHDFAEMLYRAQPGRHRTPMLPEAADRHAIEALGPQVGDPVEQMRRSRVVPVE